MNKPLLVRAVDGLLSSPTIGNFRHEGLLNENPWLIDSGSIFTTYV